MMSNLITPHHFALEEIDPQVRGGGGGGGASSRPWDKGGGVGGGLQKIVFSAQFGLKIRGWGGAPATTLVFNYAAIVYSEIT